jgi:hypothetical protein
MFNHMIAAFSDGGRRLFLDPTCMPCELGSLPEMDVEGQALVLNPRAPEKLFVPPPDQLPSVELEIEASADALANAAARIVLRNEPRFAATELRRTAAPEKLQRSLSALLGGRLGGILLREFRFDATPADRTVLTATADLTRFVVRSPTRLYLPQTPFSVVDKLLRDRGGDPHLVYVGRRDHFKLRIRLRAPGYGIAAPVEEKWGSPEVAEFATRLEAEPSPGGPAERFVVSYSYREQVKRLTGSARASYLALCRRYLQAGRAMHVLVRGAI